MTEYERDDKEGSGFFYEQPSDRSHPDLVLFDFAGFPESGPAWHAGSEYRGFPVLVRGGTDYFRIGFSGKQRGDTMVQRSSYSDRSLGTVGSVVFFTQVLYKAVEKVQKSR